MTIAISVKARLVVNAKDGKFLFYHASYEYVWKPPKSFVKKDFRAMQDMARLIFLENAKSFIGRLISENRSYQDLIDEQCDAQWWRPGFNPSRSSYWSLEAPVCDITEHEI